VSPSTRSESSFVLDVSDDALKENHIFRGGGKTDKKREEEGVEEGIYNI
jgi:hypothetical protein